MSYLTLKINTGDAVLHRDQEDAAYRKAIGLSQSALKDFLKSPAHYQSALKAERSPTKDMQFGTAYHSRLLDSKPRYAVKEKVDGRTKEGKAYNALFEEQNAGLAVIDTEQNQDLENMVSALERHSKIGDLHKRIWTEVSVFCDIYTDHGAVSLKGRIDGYDPETGTIYDWKSAEDASKRGFAKAVRNNKYWLQNIHYPVLLLANGLPVNKFVFIAQEKEAPFAPATYELTANTLIYAEAEWRKQIDLFAQCQNSGIWPSYSEEVEFLDVSI